MSRKEAKKQLNKRQDYILTVLESKESRSVNELHKQVEDTLGPISRITLKRDLGHLFKLGFVVRQGKARGTAYQLSPHYNLIRSINPKSYFTIKTDERPAKKRFDFEIFTYLKNIFTPEERHMLKALDEEYQTHIKNLPLALVKKEFERLTIEFSWKSSEIEGNTYTLLETETLIQNQQEAPGHNKDEAMMILNHKTALDYIWNNRERFKKVSLAEIENVHTLLMNELGVTRGLRSSMVGIIGTTYKPLDNAHQIREAMEKMERVINGEPDFFAKAVIFMALIAYIQPFEDGNKRTSRLVGNAILMAHNSCPLSYRSVNEGEYKKAVILFYEQGNIAYFKKLFIEQFEFAVKNYFR